MNEQRKENAHITGIIAIIINSIILVISTLFFIPMFVEQITYGAGTKIELAVILFWFIDFFLIIGLFITLILTIVSLISKDSKWRVICNFSIIAVSILLMILTTIFMVI